MKKSENFWDEAVLGEPQHDEWDEEFEAARKSNEFEPTSEDWVNHFKAESRNLLDSETLAIIDKNMLEKERKAWIQNYKANITNIGSTFESYMADYHHIIYALNPNKSYNELLEEYRKHDINEFVDSQLPDELRGLHRQYVKDNDLDAKAVFPERFELAHNDKFKVNSQKQLQELAAQFGFANPERAAASAADVLKKNESKPPKTSAAPAATANSGKEGK